MAYSGLSTIWFNVEMTKAWTRTPLPYLTMVKASVWGAELKPAAFVAVTATE
jgi:hypothetical protein